MSASLKASVDGTQAIIQVAGVDKVVVGATGIEAGSYKAGSIKPSDIAGGTGSGNLTTYTSAVTPLPATATAVSVAHGVGAVPMEAVFEVTCLTAEAGYSIGDVIQNPSLWNGSNPSPIPVWKNATNVGVVLANTYVIYAPNKTTGAGTTLTAANWSYRFRLRTV